MAWIARLIKHRMFDETDTARALPSAALDRLEARIRDGERRHRGEIRVCVESGLPLSYLRRGASARERAVMMFGKLRVWDTEDNTGVLIYLLLAERAIEIVADRGIARHVPEGHWQAMLEGMRLEFRAGRFEQGLLQAIDAVETELLQHAALDGAADNPNELPNRPYVF